MSNSESPVGGKTTADPLLSPTEVPPEADVVGEPPEASEVAAAETEVSGGEPEVSGGETEVEVVDGLPVVAEVRTIERGLAAGLPAVQVAAVAATGFVAGAATVAIVKRRAARKVARNGRGGSRRAVDLLPIAASRSFLVDVHVLAKPE